jgi:hypothetical protein
MALPDHSGPRPLIQFRNYFSQTAELLGRVISPSQGFYLNTGQHKHRINAYTYQPSMPSVRFESTIPASKQAKTVHALDRAATVTGRFVYDTLVLRNMIRLCYSLQQTLAQFKEYVPRKKCVQWIHDELT